MYDYTIGKVPSGIPPIRNTYGPCDRDPKHKDKNPNNKDRKEIKNALGLLNNINNKSNPIPSDNKHTSLVDIINTQDYLYLLKAVGSNMIQTAKTEAYNNSDKPESTAIIVNKYV